MRNSDNILSSAPLPATHLKQSGSSHRERAFSSHVFRYASSKDSHRLSFLHTVEICTSLIAITSNDDKYNVVSCSNAPGNAHGNTATTASSVDIRKGNNVSGAYQTRSISHSGGPDFKQAGTMVGSYSSAKLAPPLIGASVVDYEQRRTLHGQKVWYSIQVYPCPIIFPSRAGLESLAPIPRKSYKVFRKFEDMMDFAIRLEDEFPWLKSNHDTALKTGIFMSVSLRNKTTSSWSSLKVRHSQALTDAECDQRKRDMNQYLQQLFTLGPAIGQSVLVAEFFGIWKTDLDAHLLRKEDRDPLALHCLVSHQFEFSPVVSSVSAAAPKDSSAATESPQASPAIWSRTSSTSTCPTLVASQSQLPASTDLKGLVGFPWGEATRASTTPSSTAPKLAPALANWASVLRVPLSPQPPQSQNQLPVADASTPQSLSSSSRESLPSHAPYSPPGSSYHSTDEEFNALSEISDSDEGDMSNIESIDRLEKCPRFYHDTLAMPSLQNSVKKSTSLQDLRRSGRYQPDLRSSQTKGWPQTSSTAVDSKENSADSASDCKPALVTDSGHQSSLQNPESKCHICNATGAPSRPIVIPESVMKASTFSHSGYKLKSPLSTSPVITPQTQHFSSRLEGDRASRESREAARGSLYPRAEISETVATGAIGVNSQIFPLIERCSPKSSRSMRTLANSLSSELSRSRRPSLVTTASRSKSLASMTSNPAPRPSPSTSIDQSSATTIDRAIEVSTMPSVPTFVSWVDHRPIPHLKLPPSKTGRSAVDQPRYSSAPIKLFPPTAVSSAKEQHRSSQLERQYRLNVKGPHNKGGKTENRPTPALADAAAFPCHSFFSTSAPSTFRTSSYPSVIYTNNNNNNNNNKSNNKNGNDHANNNEHNRSFNDGNKSITERPSSPLAAVTTPRTGQPPSPIKTPVSIFKNVSYLHSGSDHKVSNGVTSKSFGKRSSGGIHQLDNNNNYTVSQHNNSGTNGNLDSLDLPQDERNQDGIEISYFSSRGGLEDQVKTAAAVPGQEKSSSGRDINIGSDSSPTSPDQVSSSPALRTPRKSGPRRAPTPHPLPPQRQRSGASGISGPISPFSPSSFTRKQKKRDQDHKHRSDPAPVTSDSSSSSPASSPTSSRPNTRQLHQNQLSPTPERATSPIPGSGFLSQHPRAFVATFKIVVDAERIIALQVLEPDQDFRLSIPDLRRRVQNKFERMEMPLPRDFELVWTAWHGQKVVLKNDQELHQAVGSSANNKVTLRCLF